MKSRIKQEGKNRAKNQNRRVLRLSSSLPSFPPLYSFPLSSSPLLLIFSFLLLFLLPFLPLFPLHFLFLLLPFLVLLSFLPPPVSSGSQPFSASAHHQNSFLDHMKYLPPRAMKLNINVVFLAYFDAFPSFFYTHYFNYFICHTQIICVQHQLCVSNVRYIFPDLLFGFNILETTSRLMALVLLDYACEVFSNNNVQKFTIFT